jgi:cell division transport system ATP-binding protein
MNPIFSGLSFQMDAGEFCFLIGKSGCGKSTLLQMIYMNLFPQSGTIQFDRYNSLRIKSKDLPFLRRKLGIIFQDFKLLKNRNIYDNLAFILEVVNTPEKEIKTRAIVNEPVLILADEPTGNLDPDTSSEIMEILQRINARGTAVLIATHNYDIIKKVNARILKIEDRKVIKVMLKPKT